LNQVVPLAVYLRWSKDDRKRELKQRWCRAAGLEVIAEPPRAMDPTSRAMACVEAVRRGRALVMTPDLAQKADQGVGVELLGRRVFLPGGPASIAMLAGVPMMPLMGRTVRERHEVYACEAIRVPSLSRSEGGRSQALQRATQEWVRHFEQFLRAEPELWFFWADKHWSRVFGGDPRYVQPTGPSAAAGCQFPVAAPRTPVSRYAP
jgi:lauroyl/myristoyl acyltransferase